MFNRLVLLARLSIVKTQHILKIAGDFGLASQHGRLHELWFLRVIEEVRAGSPAKEF